MTPPPHRPSVVHAALLEERVEPAREPKAEVFGLDGCSCLFQIRARADEPEVSRGMPYSIRIVSPQREPLC
jgi:hypothetical protein